MTMIIKENPGLVGEVRKVGTTVDKTAVYPRFEDVNRRSLGQGNLRVIAYLEQGDKILLTGLVTEPEGENKIDCVQICGSLCGWVEARHIMPV